MPAAERATHLEYARRLNGYPQPEQFVDAVTILGTKVIELLGHQGSVAIEQHLLVEFERLNTLLAILKYVKLSPGVLPGFL